MKDTLKYVAIATACWLLLAVSIGWYYTVTYFGRVGWPMPSMETIGALLLYYFSVLNVDTELQALHWLVVFPMAGFLWAVLLPFSAQPSLPRPTRAKLAATIAMCSLPLSLPLPYMAYVAGQTAEGWQLQRMLAVALRRGNIDVWPWLSPMYFSLGIVAFALHLWVLKRMFPQPALGLVRQVSLTAIAFALLICVVGTAASFPLRAWLE